MEFRSLNLILLLAYLPGVIWGQDANESLKKLRIDVALTLEEKSDGFTAEVEVGSMKRTQTVPDGLTRILIQDLQLNSVPDDCRIILRDKEGQTLKPPRFSKPLEQVQVRPTPKGALMIHGGGRLTRDFVDRFVQLAGGKDAPVVAIPTALGGDIDPDTYRERWLESAGFTNITILHTRDPKVADTDAFVAALKKANAVWLSGGRQWRMADAYLNTKVQSEIQKLYERGGVIAGSSAGATIQGSYLVRGDTRGNQLMMSEGHEQGFGLMPNVAIDQHVIARNRLNDIVPVIERFSHLLGIGIDESTAIVVQDSVFEVIGESKVAIYDAATWKSDETETPPQTDTGNTNNKQKSSRYFFLRPPQRYNWRKRVILDQKK